MGTPCTKWTTARASNRKNPSGPSDPCARFTVSLIKLCFANNVYFVLENPKSSALWRWEPLCKALRTSGSLDATFPMCAFGTPYQKYTRFSGTLPGLDSLNRVCCCGLPHEHLQGLVRVVHDGKPKWVWKTSLAGRYPARLCQAFTKILAAAAPASGWRQPGEHTFKGKCSDELRRIYGDDPSFKLRVPSCPHTSAGEWDEATEFKLTDGSREKRLRAQVKQAR